MAYVRWLQHAISCLQDDRGSLIFVHHFHPAFVAIDHLKFDVVMMDVVRNRTSLRDADMRSDHATAETIRYQIAVLHARAPRDPLIGPYKVAVVALLEATLNTVAGQFGDARRVGRKDHVDPKAKIVSIEVDCSLQVTAWQQDNDYQALTA